MKIKVTTKAPTATLYGESDYIPAGVYIDADGDIVVHQDGYFANFSPDGEVLGSTPNWPIVKAPAGTKIEITA